MPKEIAMDLRPLTLREEIQSPLAAIRNALALIAAKSDDASTMKYVKLAQQQAEEIGEAVNRHSLRSRTAEAA